MASSNIGKEINGFLILDSSTKTTNKSRMIIYKTKCLNCGEIEEKCGSNVLKGTAACRKCSKKHEYHKQSKTRLYHIYNSMISRCYKENNNRYASYGGKGIKVCNEWLDSFTAFYKWAISNGYSDNLSIDRIDVNGNYEPSNCRWATYAEQMNNTTKNHYLEYDGRKQTIAQWAKETYISYSTINQRINKLKWSVERALITPSRLEKRGVQSGETKS